MKAAVERAAGDAQEPGGGDTITADLAQHLHDVLAVALADHVSAREWVRGNRRLRRRGGGRDASEVAL